MGACNRNIPKERRGRMSRDSQKNDTGGSRKQPTLARTKDMGTEGPAGARLWRALNVRLRNLSRERNDQTGASGG